MRGSRAAASATVTERGEPRAPSAFSAAHKSAAVLVEAGSHVLLIKSFVAAKGQEGPKRGAESLVLWKSGKGCLGRNAPRMHQSRQETHLPNHFRLAVREICRSALTLLLLAPFSAITLEAV